MRGLCDIHGWYRPIGRRPACPQCYRNTDLRLIYKAH